MSLFGDSSPEQAHDTSASLFENPAPKTPQKSSKGSTGLFAETDDTGSPWNSTLTPKKQDRFELIRNLLPADSVPSFYVDTFEALVEEGFVQGAGVSKRGVERVLEGSRLTPVDRSNVLDITGASSWDKDTFTRGEFNVLLALVGLAQEGEEVSLDSVDERKRSKILSHALRIISC